MLGEIVEVVLSCATMVAFGESGGAPQGFFQSSTRYLCSTGAFHGGLWLGVVRITSTAQQYPL